MPYVDLSRRGTPKQIFSDNGTNFMGAAKILKDSSQSLNSDKIDLYCSQRNIEWNFNPLTASRMGGAWEHMICSIRKILRNLLVTQTLNDEGCLTLMAEVDAII